MVIITYYAPSALLRMEKNIIMLGTIYAFTFSHLADAFIQSDVQLGNT